MKKAVLVMLVTGLVATPVQAAEWNDVRPGTFVGARLTIGNKSAGRPVAALMIAPTQSRISGNGMIDTRIGDGVAFNLTPGARPTLTLAGVRADQVLGLNPNGSVDADRKLGISTGGWIAIGLGLAALVGGAIVFNRLKEADEHSD